MAEADRTTPQTIRRKTKKKKVTRAPSTTDRTSPNPTPSPKPRKGPPSPQRTGRATRPQPVARKRNAAPTTTDRSSDSKRTPAQKRKDKAASDRAIREARVKVLRKRSKPLTDRITVSSKGTVILKSDRGPKRVGKGFPGATANPLDDLGSPLGAEVNRLITRRARPDDAKAPAIKALDIVARPAYAVSSGAKAKIRYVKQHGYKPFDSGARKAAVKGAERGLTGKEKTLGSDVLKELGVKNKIARGVGGFVWDMATDPTRAAKVTRLSPKVHFERAAAEEAAAAAKAARGGRVKPARPAKAARHAARAEKLRKKAETASDSPGIQVGSHGPHHRLMTSGKVSSKVGRKVAPAAEKVRGSRAAEAVKGVAAPTARRAGESPEERDAFVYAERKRRARKNEGRRKSQRRGTAHARGSKGVDTPEMIAAAEGAAKKPLTDTMRSKRTHPAHQKVTTLKQRVTALKLKHAKAQGRVRALVDSDAPKVQVTRAMAHEKRIADEIQIANANLASARDAAKGVPRTVEVLAEVADRKVDSKGRVIRTAGRPYSEFKDKADTYTIDELPPKAQAVARATEKELGEYKTRQQDAGNLEGSRDPYYPHRAIPQKTSRKGRGGRKPAHTLRRKDERPIHEQHAERAAKGQEPVFSTDHPTVMANYVDKAESGLAEAGFLKDMKAAGKPLTAANWAKRRDTDGLYRITPTSIQPVRHPSGKDLSDSEVLDLIAKGEDVTILPKSRGDAEVAGRVGGKSDQTKAALKVLNKPMQVFKTAATVLNIPFYQIRNFMDDSFHAYTADTPPSAFPKATALVKDLALKERREGRQLTPADVKGTVTVAGKDMPRSQFLQEAVEDGAARTGFHAGDDLLEGSMKPATGVRRIRPVQKIREWSQNAEDVPRLATYLAARDRGMTRREAAAHMRIHHFDYDELTDIERVIRATLVPFYTYAKKNTVLMTRLFLTRPGKLSTVEKLRQEFNKYGDDSDQYRQAVDRLRPLLDQAVKQGILTRAEVNGLYKGKFEGLLTDADQRGLPFLGPDGSLQYMPLGATDLGRIPFATSWNELSQLPGRQLDLALQMVGPQKLPLELHQNYSFFFRDAIYRDGKNPTAERWVTAPPWAKKVGIPTVRQKIDGEMVDAWPAKLDYTIRALGPQAGMLATVGNPAKTGRGSTWQDMVLKQVTGVRRARFDDRLLAGIISRAAEKLAEVNVAIADVGDVPDGKGKIDPLGRYPGGGIISKRYKALTQRQKDLQELIDHLRTARTGAKPEKVLRVAPRPLSPREAADKELKKLRSTNPREEIEREMARDRAKQRIIRSGG